MKDSDRKYIIYEQLTGGRAYLRSFDDLPDSSSAVPYAWTSKRSDAMRIVGKTCALLAAKCLEYAITSRGYTPGTICVQPASGGMNAWR